MNIKSFYFFWFSILMSLTLQAQSTEKSQNQPVHDTTFVNLTEYSSAFILDLRYATENNFLKAKVYDCASCYLRFKTVKKLIEAQDLLKEKGYKIKLFDCYRPLDVQKKMWQIVPNPIYVADPAKGSIHNRGGAVDITLVDVNGQELDMGTEFDYFGSEASHDYLKLKPEVLKNREMLRNVMVQVGFKMFQSEWWHYNLPVEPGFSVANFKWDCKD
ncbi:M15 family metallopeptidase [Flavobacterium sp.]|uniref:M15 family metallopeptidase n=1 Tax=Flavobacterium sp. TaxID=239 RepID=UPI003FA59459